MPLPPDFLRRALTALVLGMLTGSALRADDSLYELPKFTIYSDAVANQTPAGSFAMPVSGLRFEPRVDVQARNLAEAQADVTLRGGIFENTGFKLGALAVFDPQTGHYLAELPVAPAMLLSPAILTGAGNALGGFNAGVGTIAYGWRPIEQRGEVSAAFGDYASNRQSLYQGVVRPRGPGGSTFAADLELARSVSAGSVPFGDHDFQRVAGRLQWRGVRSQTDLFAGAQRKFFGWPNLYTPFGFNETEDLHTNLYLINHRVQLAEGEYWQVGAYYRRNYDDYEFNRAVPGLFNPYQHTTKVRAFAGEGRSTWGDTAIAYRASYMADSLESTSLTFGRFHTRDYYKLAVVPERELATAAGRLTLRAGATYDATNRDGSAVSPVLEASVRRSGDERYYVQYSQSTQVPTYTALNSNPASGLFRGNPNLGRERSRNLEIGLERKAGGWSLQAAAFYRWDDALTDWTFRRGVTARTANAVDIGTAGVEVVAVRRTPRYDVILGCTGLTKQADYGTATVDASFYALNFPRLRVTAAVVLRLGAGWEVRLDNEYRVQEKNLLRTIGGNTAVSSAGGVYYLPPACRGLELSALVENIWDSDFQDVPAVPAARRQFSVGAAWRW